MFIIMTLFLQCLCDGDALVKNTKCTWFQVMTVLNVLYGHIGVEQNDLHRGGVAFNAFFFISLLL